MKTKSYDQLVIGIVIGALAFVIIQYILVHFIGIGETKSPVSVSKKIKTEYFLEVSEDSIWIESRHGDVYSGTYSQLDSLINLDNL